MFIGHAFVTLLLISSSRVPLDTGAVVARREAIRVMIEMQDFSGEMGQSLLQETAPKKIGDAANRWRALKLKWQGACQKYEAALKSEAAAYRTKRKKTRAKLTTKKALASLKEIKRETNRYAEGSGGPKAKNGELFFVGMINFGAARD